MQVEPQSRVREISMMAKSRALKAFLAVAAVNELVSVVFRETSSSMVAIQAALVATAAC
jgi:hypothetical protein